jgi:hypothetical protein
MKERNGGGGNCRRPGRVMKLKGKRLATTTKQNIFLFMAKPINPRRQQAAGSSATCPPTHSTLTLTLNTLNALPCSAFFSFPPLHNCFFTCKRKTFSTVQGSLPILPHPHTYLLLTNRNPHIHFTHLHFPTPPPPFLFLFFFFFFK